MISNRNGSQREDYMVWRSAYYEKPHIHLEIRRVEVGPNREYSHSAPIFGIIPRIYSANAKR